MTCSRSQGTVHPRPHTSLLAQQSSTCPPNLDQACLDVYADGVGQEVGEGGCQL